MTKFEIIIAKLAKLETENIAQTKSIDGIHITVADHIKTSELFRDKCLKNENDLKWIKRIALSILTGGGLITLFWKFIKAKIGG